MYYMGPLNSLLLGGCWRIANHDEFLSIIKTNTK